MGVPLTGRGERQRSKSRALSAPPLRWMTNRAERKRLAQMDRFGNTPGEAPPAHAPLEPFFFCSPNGSLEARAATSVVLFTRSGRTDSIFRPCCRSHHGTPPPPPSSREEARGALRFSQQRRPLACHRCPLSRPGHTGLHPRERAPLESARGRHIGWDEFGTPPLRYEKTELFGLSCIFKAVF